MPPWVCFKLSLSCNCLFDFFCGNFVFFRNSMRNYRREPLVEKIQDSVVHVPEPNAQFINAISQTSCRAIIDGKEMPEHPTTLKRVKS